jgi:hypothetical protein
VTYIDECVGPDSSAFYLGVFYTMAILGPALGYSIGGQFLNIHADFLRFFYIYCRDPSRQFFLLTATTNVS